jgi:hypothetical protein
MLSAQFDRLLNTKLFGAITAGDVHIPTRRSGSIDPLMG